jgi:hypothetical protein
MSFRPKGEILIFQKLYFEISRYARNDMGMRLYEFIRVNDDCILSEEKNLILPAFPETVSGFPGKLRSCNH